MNKLSFSALLWARQRFGCAVQVELQPLDCLFSRSLVFLLAVVSTTGFVVKLGGIRGGGGQYEVS